MLEKVSLDLIKNTVVDGYRERGFMAVKSALVV